MANSCFLEPINPMCHITCHRPSPEAAKCIEAWYAVEKMTLNFGEEVGRPSANIQARRETLEALFAQGWYVYAVSFSGSCGCWTKVSTAHEGSISCSSASSFGFSCSCSCSTSGSCSCNNGDSKAKSKSQGSSTAGYNAWFGRDQSTSKSCGCSTSCYFDIAKTQSNGKNMAIGKEQSCGRENVWDDVNTCTIEGGAPYYEAYSVIELHRKRMQSDKVLNTMINMLVADYNKQKTINLDRYDEIVALYALMLSRTESEGNAMIEDGICFTPLFDDIKSRITTALNDLKCVAANIPNCWLASREAEINRKFCALIGQARAKMVSEGTFGTTVWTQVNSAFEHDRQLALNNLKDEMVTLKVDTYGKIADISANVGNNLMAAQVRIFEALQKKRIEPVNLRNTVFKWMLEFMERRKDEFPALTEIPTVAERLGYSGGIAYDAPTTPTQGT